MFSNLNHEALLEASKRANLLNNQWEELLAFRISLQRPLELANKLPAVDVEELVQNNVDEHEHASFQQDRLTVMSELKEIAGSLLDCLNLDSPLKKVKKNAPSSSVLRDLDTQEIWGLISERQKALEPFWQRTLEKWSARVVYGSERAKASFKVLALSPWAQIEGAMRDEGRVVEKTRPLLQESPRIDSELEGRRLAPLLAARGEESEDEEGEGEGEGEGEEGEQGGLFGYVDNVYIEPSKSEGSSGKRRGGGEKRRRVRDCEVYEDSPFYSLLLKSFLSSGQRRDVGKASLSRGRRVNSGRDRKASKGRRLRYAVHDKLRHFMFPLPVREERLVDRDRLYASLFQ